MIQLVSNMTILALCLFYLTGIKISCEPKENVTTGQGSEKS